MQKDIGSECFVVVEGYSSEHDLLLSARKISWEREIDGEIYINENELDTQIEFGKIYQAKITELAGDKLLGTIVAKG